MVRGSGPTWSSPLCGTRPDGCGVSARSPATLQSGGRRRRNCDGLRDELERRFKERTSELAKVNASLKAELTARKRAEEAIRELSTPVLPIRERLLVLPLIGIIDSVRAVQLTEQLLGSIRTHRAKAVVMDITGVAEVDSKVANHLLQTVEAARLMGAKVIVSGISSEIAQTLVRIGVDLSGLRTTTDLRGGLEEAEQLVGYQRAPRRGSRPVHGPAPSRAAIRRTGAVTEPDVAALP